MEAGAAVAAEDLTLYRLRIKFAAEIDVIRHKFVKNTECAAEPMGKALRMWLQGETRLLPSLRLPEDRR